MTPMLGIIASSISGNLAAPWTAATLPSSANWIAATFDNGLFVVVGEGGTSAASSTDGITWTARTLNAGQSWRGVVGGGGYFVACSFNAGPGTKSFSRSSDGINWSACTTNVRRNFIAIGYNSGTFASVVNNDTSAVTSTDSGDTWTDRTLPSSAYGTESQVVAVL